MAARETVFIRELLVDLRVPIQGATVMNVAFKKTKHILRDAEYLRDMVSREAFTPKHVPSAEQRADIFTKQLLRSVFNTLRAYLTSDVTQTSP